MVKAGAKYPAVAMVTKLSVVNTQCAGLPYTYYIVDISRSPLIVRKAMVKKTKAWKINLTTFLTF